MSCCFNGNIVPNLDGASLKEALLGLFGARARAKKKGPDSTRKRNSLTTTGAFRVTLPGTPPASDRVSTVSTTGSFGIGPSIEAPARTSITDGLPRPSITDAPRSVPPDLDESVPPPRVGERISAPPETRPMQPAAAIATPIETPIPMPSGSQPPREGND